jgi:hypothetical protein
MYEIELQKEMTRYIELTKGWSGPHKYKILCSWMGAVRMRAMNDFLGAQSAKEVKEVGLHSDDAPGA